MNTLLIHYIKIAWRNLLKHRLQSIISILGLGIGFACFAISTLWIRYEMNYDNFHEGADRIYYVRMESTTNDLGLSSITPDPLAAYLEATFPEIEYACNTCRWGSELKYDEVKHSVSPLEVDSAFMHVFQIRLIEGSTDYMIEEKQEVAISESLALRLFGKESALGKQIELNRRIRTIGAVVKEWPEHTNLPFEVLVPAEKDMHWSHSSKTTFLKLKKGIDIDSFSKKIYEHEIEEGPYKLGAAVLTPIKAMRYDRPQHRTETIRFNHIILFLVVAGLIIFCALFNYLTLFITSLYTRVKEISLRMVCGSSDRGLMALFSIEFLICILFAVLIGFILLEVSLTPFRELSEIKADKGSIYLEALFYSVGIAILSYLISIIPIFYARNRALASTLKGIKVKHGKNIFARISIFVQLMVSAGIVFCAVIMMKQLHFLGKTEQIIERKGKATLQVRSSNKAVSENLKQLPFITEVLDIKYGNEILIPQIGATYTEVFEYDEKQSDKEHLSLEMLCGETPFLQYYGITLLEGEMLEEGAKRDKVLVNETAVRQLGWDRPIGKTIRIFGDRQMQVAGVVRDFCKTAPTVPIQPLLFTSIHQEHNNEEGGGMLLFSYSEGQWKECKKSIEQMLKTKHPEVVTWLRNTEEEYDKYLQSEKSLMLLLDFVSLVCILICLFGIFSLVTLQCEQRQSEITIRRINGATIKHILSIFFIEYGILLTIAVMIAFPIGYLIMNSWLQNYIAQTTINWWIYFLIWLVLTILISLCTVWRIWKTANQNPADVLKTE